MRGLPLSLGTIHFIGIGGIGMSGIAEVLHTLGYTVKGSDIGEGPNVLRLRDLGIPVTVGHVSENLGAAQVVVVSSAVKVDNPEVIAARDNLIPVVRRAEMLSELMRLKWSIAVGGTHGKTTTTSIIASLLDSADMDPTVINGGIINAWGSNARLGSGEWMVAEADESDGTFLKLPATVAVVTNIDAEHMEYYGSFDRLRDAFDAFVQNIPFYGFACLCIDHPEVQSMIPRVSDRRILTYGLSPQADIRAVNLQSSSDGTCFDVIVKGRKAFSGRTIEGLRLPMIGEHNTQNSLAAIAIASEMNMSDDVIRRSLGNFAGVKRRFTQTGNVDGIVIIDDYGHHPVEISAVLKAARANVIGKVIAVVQPHRYSRLGDLFEEFCTCFNDADAVIVADVYAAGEIPIKKINKESLVEGLRHHGHRSVEALPAPQHLADLVAKIATPGDMVVCMGAGNISEWAAELPNQLEALRSGREEASDDSC